MTCVRSDWKTKAISTFDAPRGMRVTVDSSAVTCVRSKATVVGDNRSLITSVLAGFMGTDPSSFHRILRYTVCAEIDMYQNARELCSIGAVCAASR